MLLCLAMVDLIGCSRCNVVLVLLDPGLNGKPIC
jgi:hypothetical protein